MRNAVHHMDMDALHAHDLDSDINGSNYGRTAIGQDIP